MVRGVGAKVAGLWFLQMTKVPSRVHEDCDGILVTYYWLKMFI